MMHTQGYGVNLITAMSLSVLQFVCYVFVDDADVIHSGATVETTGEEILGQMQEVVDHWEGGLRATGGAIVPSKSYWYLLDYEWTGHKWKYRKKADMPGKIDICSIDGQSQVPLQRFEPDHAKETLGVFLAMNGNNKEEIKKL